MRDENQLHAAYVELVAHDNAEIKYSTVQTGILAMKMARAVFTFVTKRIAHKKATISWTQIETGSASGSTVLKGDNSSGAFYSVALTHNHQADTGTKMIHLGKNTSSTIISKEYLQAKHKTPSWLGKSCT